MSGGGGAKIYFELPDDLGVSVKTRSRCRAAGDRRERERATSAALHLAPMRSDDDDRCSISTSVETRCHTDENGAWKCEELRRKFRHCPGRAPEEISVERAETDAPPPRAPFASFGGEGSPHDFFAQVESMLSGFGFGGLGVPLLPPRRAPPDRAREPPPPPRVTLQVDEV